MRRIWKLYEMNGSSRIKNGNQETTVPALHLSTTALKIVSLKEVSCTRCILLDFSRYLCRKILASSTSYPASSVYSKTVHTWVQGVEFERSCSWKLRRVTTSPNNSHRTSMSITSAPRNGLFCFLLSSKRSSEQPTSNRYSTPRNNRILKGIPSSDYSLSFSGLSFAASSVSLIGFMGTAADSFISYAVAQW